ncbi:MAG: hypothetical protein IJX24_01065, partial [Oscillospiraceae bacterium]|nr:hypothetical protein [Oscillospiraceae bacterium]
YDIPDSEKYRENKKFSSYYNVYEAETVKKILCVIEKNLSVNNCHKSVGVITFYDAQVKLLEDEIIKSGFCGRFGHITLRIGSVDRFQGMEEDIIIVSFVRNNPEHLIGFARDSRRINVAMSRAKDLLIITGCSENFIKSSNPESSRMFYNIYDITKKLGGIRNAAEIPDIRLENMGYNPCQSDTGRSSGQNNDDAVSSDDNVNILDYFILKAAVEFKEQHLSLKNISNALGIAPVFVENRINYLKRENLLEYRNKLVKITPNGENAVNALTNDYSM